MHPHEIHHIKAYVLFFLVSTLSIGLLIYLYFPQWEQENIQSSTLEVAPIISKKVSEGDSGVVGEEQKSLSDKESGRRMRLTQILIRSKKELQTLEEQRKSSPQGLDPLSEQKILKLTEKIATIEKMITEIK